MNEYEDFRLRITCREDGSYDVEADGGEGETARANFELPFTADDMGDIAERVARTRRVTRGRQPATSVRKMEQFGGQLFETVFKPDIDRIYRTACQRVEDRDVGIRLVLALQNAPGLMDVPWEFLFDRPNFLSLSRTSPVVRVLELPHVRKPVKIEGAVRVLGMVSSPLNYPTLDVEAERRVVDDALAPLVRQGLAEVVWLPSASLSALNEALMSGDFHVFHYVGHAGFDSHASEGVLVLEHAEDRSGDEVSGRNLGAILCDHRPLRLAVINACEGARSSPDDAFTGVGSCLAEREIPAIVAMQYQITDTAALVFARSFYRSLVGRRQPVDIAVADARKELFAQDAEALEWATPVLFMGKHDVSLFDFRGHDTDEHVPSPDVTQVAPRHDRQQRTGGDHAPTQPELDDRDAQPERRIAADDSAATPVPAEPWADAPTSAPPPPDLHRLPNRPRVVDAPTAHSEVFLRAEELFDLQHGFPISSAAISKNGWVAATVAADGSVIAWNATSGQFVRRWTGLRAPHDVTLSQDGSLIAVAAANGCWVFSTSNDQPLALLSPGKDSKRAVMAVEFNPDGSSLVAANERGVVERWALDKWRSLGRVEAPKRTGTVTKLASGKTGGAIAVATATGQLWFWNPPRKPWISTAVSSQGPITDLVGVPAGWAAAIGMSAVIINGEFDRVWRAQSLASTITTLDLSDNEEWLVAATQDCRIALWDSSGVQRLETRSSSVLSCVRFTPTGLFSAGSDGTARIWRVSEVPPPA